jgi:co-chaperonin GroES (HSP10)
MRPLANKVLVERIEAEKVSAGGIVLQRTDGPDKAKILAVGPDVKEVAVGEVALINWNAATKAGDQQYIVPEDNIVFVYEEE